MNVGVATKLHRCYTWPFTIVATTFRMLQPSSTTKYNSLLPQIASLYSLKCCCIWPQQIVAAFGSEMQSQDNKLQVFWSPYTQSDHLVMLQFRMLQPSSTTKYDSHKQHLYILSNDVVFGHNKLWQPLAPKCSFKIIN